MHNVCFCPRCVCCVLWGITCSRATDRRRLAAAGWRWTTPASPSASWAVMYLGSSMLSTVTLWVWTLKITSDLYRRMNLGKMIWWFPLVDSFSFSIYGETQTLALISFSCLAVLATGLPADSPVPDPGGLLRSGPPSLPQQRLETDTDDDLLLCGRHQRDPRVSLGLA